MTGAYKKPTEKRHSIGQGSRMIATRPAAIVTPSHVQATVLLGAIPQPGSSMNKVVSSTGTKTDAVRSSADRRTPLLLAFWGTRPE